MVRMNKLWKAVGRTDAPPTADRRAVKVRVNAALNADAEERRIYMKQKLRAALAAAAIAAAITGSALAAGSNLDVLPVFPPKETDQTDQAPGVLEAFFQGDISSVWEYADKVEYSASDEDYTLAVESSISDEYAAYLVITVTAHSEEARQALFAAKLFSPFASTVVYEDGASGGVRRVSSSELTEKRTEDSRTFRLMTGLSGPANAVHIRLCLMGEEGMIVTSSLEVEVPLAPAPSVTVEMGVSGTGIPVRGTAVPSTLTVQEVTLTPFTCQITCPDRTLTFDSLTDPRIFFRMADGSIRTQSQMMSAESSNQTSYRYRFYEVQTLENIKSVIAFDTEYPLDGSGPIALAHDPSLDPITLPKLDPLCENGGYTLSAQALTEALGGVCVQNPETGETACSYRGVTVVLTPGSEIALVNGVPVETQAPARQNGVLAADSRLFFDAWGLDGFLQWVEQGGDLTWGDWYILP